MKNRKILTSLLLVLSIGLMLGIVSAQISTGNTAALRESESTTLLINGKTYDVTLNYVDTNSAQFTINGQTTRKLSGGGDTTATAGGESQILSDGVSILIVNQVGGNQVPVSFTIAQISNDQTELQNNDCTDSDGGKNYFVKGILNYTNYRGETFVSYDVCVNDSVLVEGFCGPNSIMYECPTGCLDGACISAPFEDETCYDSDGGLNYFVKGYVVGCNDPFADVCEYVNISDTCLQWDEEGASIWANYGERVQEVNCVFGGPDVSEYLCPNGCLNGACVDITSGDFICSDTDNGRICLKPLNPERNEPLPIEIPDSFKKDNTLSSLCLGCLKEETCYPLGYRKNNEFCSENKTFTSQLGSDSFCENNFECISNVCISGKCIPDSFIQKILNWFTRLFGRE
jgi:hypothetical protein